MDLDAVEAGGCGVPGSGGEAVDDLLDVRRVASRGVRNGPLPPYAGIISPSGGTADGAMVPLAVGVALGQRAGVHELGDDPAAAAWTRSMTSATRRGAARSPGPAGSGSPGCRQRPGRCPRSRPGRTRRRRTRRSSRPSPRSARRRGGRRPGSSGRPSVGSSGRAGPSEPGCRAGCAWAAVMQVFPSLCGSSGTGEDVEQQVGGRPGVDADQVLRAGGEHDHGVDVADEGDGIARRVGEGSQLSVPSARPGCS